MANIQQISDATFWNEVKATKLALVDFWAPWCGPCRILGPILEEVNKTSGDKVTIMKLNVDENPMIPNSFGIRGIPTMILFKNGTQAETLVGVRNIEEIEELINKHSK